MIEWQSRPIEVANLLNPAFCGVILQEFVKEYNQQTSTGVNYELIILVLPIILHKYTRDLIPHTSRTKMHIWLQEHPEVRMDFAKRVKELIPFTNESISFLLIRDLLAINDEGKFVRTTRRNRKPVTSLPTDLAVFIQKAKLVAKWFSQNSSSATIYTMWGIRP